MKQVIVLFLLVALACSFSFFKKGSITNDYDCPHDKEVTCIDDINKAFAACEKAAQEKGKDVPVDLDCMKYFAQMGEDCWDCICWVAQVQKMHIFGC